MAHMLRLCSLFRGIHPLAYFNNNLAGSGLPTIASPASATTGIQNSGVVVKEIIDTLLGLLTLEPKSIPLPVSPVVNLGHWTGEVLLPSYNKDDAQVRDTIIVNIGLSNKDLLPLIPKEIVIDPDFLLAGSHFRADSRESIPTVGAGPIEGQ